MADYFPQPSHRTAHRADSAEGRQSGWLLTAVAAAMLAVLAWVWTQQQTAQSPLPQTVQVSRQVAATPEPIVSAALATPAALPTAPAVSPPPSNAVAAAGDTRPLLP